MAAFYLSPPSSPLFRSRSSPNTEYRSTIPTSCRSPHPARSGRSNSLLLSSSLSLSSSSLLAGSDDDHMNVGFDLDAPINDDGNMRRATSHSFFYCPSTFPHIPDDLNASSLVISSNGNIVGKRARTRTYSDDYDVARTITALELSSGLDEATEHLNFLSTLLVHWRHTAVDRAKVRSWLRHYKFNETIQLLKDRWSLLTSPNMSDSTLDEATAHRLNSWQEQIQPLVDVIHSYVKEKNYFDTLPEVIIQEIFSKYLPLDGFACYPLISRSFDSILRQDVVWKTLYQRKFHGNHIPLSERMLALPCIQEPALGESFRERFISRLEDPEVGRLL